MSASLKKGGNPQWLKSTHGIDVAVGLSDALFGEIRNNPALGGPVLEEKLRKLRNVAWNLDINGEVAEDPLLTPEQRDQQFKQIVEGLQGEEKRQLLESYARLGHIYEISGLVARENFFEYQREHDEPIPGGVKEFLRTQDNVAVGDVLSKIEKPVLEVVMTAHPTNVNSLPFMKAQRALAIEIEKLNKGESADLGGALRNFQSTQILKLDGQGQPANLTVREELDTMVNFMDNIYLDAPRIFAQYDRPLTKKYGEEYKAEDLKINLRLGSWGSAGDKDGNMKITAYNTLEGIAVHSEEILKHYAYDLGSIPALSDWKDKIVAAEKKATSLREKITALREDQDKYMDPKLGTPTRTQEEMDRDFDAYSKELAAVRQGLDKNAFEADIKADYQKTQSPETLNLLRRVRTFGFTFSKIEYRETAEEYAKVVGTLLDAVGYKDKSPQERADVLTQLLDESNGSKNLAEAFKGKLDEIMKTGAGRNYASGDEKNDELAIAYQTLKRMQLARDHGDIIKDNVLAECGKLEKEDAPAADVAAQGVSNLLEAQFLQRLAQEGDKRPVMGIVPLFEEPSTMKNVTEIMGGAYHNKAYSQHMDAVAKHRGLEKTQQVQIAHSDNARRSGMQAARGFIHEAHQNLRKLNEEMGIKTEFFEGGSISDAYRNGLRCPSAMVNAFGLHDFAKFTFQGGDLLNYFNMPCATERLFTRNLAHQASGLDNPAKIKQKTNPLMDKVAISALKATLKDYEANDFTQDTMGVLLEALDYEGETRAGNATSRAAKRATGAVKAGAQVEAGAAVSLKGIPIGKIRTIAYSESGQHAGLVLSWVGSDELINHIGEAIMEGKKQIGDSPKNEQERKFLEAFGDVKELEPGQRDSHARYNLKAEHIRDLYENSPAFRDAQDRGAFAIAMTDMDAVSRVASKKMSGHNQGMGYLAKINETYKNAGWIAAAANTPKKDLNKFARYAQAQDMPNEEVSESVGAKLTYMDGEIRHKRGYRAFGIFLKEQGGLDDRDRRIVHNAVDTVVHGRSLAGDITAARAIHQLHDQAPQKDAGRAF